MEAALIGAGLLPLKDSGPDMLISLTKPGEQGRSLGLDASETYHECIAGLECRNIPRAIPKVPKQGCRQETRPLYGDIERQHRDDIAHRHVTASESGIASLQGATSQSHTGLPVSFRQGPIAIEDDVYQAHQEALATAYSTARPGLRDHQRQRIPSLSEVFQQDPSIADVYDEQSATDFSSEHGNVKARRRSDVVDNEMPSKPFRTAGILRRDYDLARNNLTKARLQYGARDETYDRLQHRIQTWQLDRKYSKEQLHLMWLNSVSKLTRRLAEAREVFEKARAAAIKGGLELTDSRSGSVNSEDERDWYSEISDIEDVVGLSREAIEKWRLSVADAPHSPSAVAYFTEGDMGR